MVQKHILRAGLYEATKQLHTHHKLLKDFEGIFHVRAVVPNLRYA